MENLHSEKLVSSDFVNCVMEDVAAHHIVPDGVRFTSLTLHAIRALFF
jgi:hypothetical protein